MSRADVLRIPDYLEHIVEGIERIHRYVSDVSEVNFLADEKTQDAVIRNFENIGEAAHNIERYHSTFADAHPDIPWTVVYANGNGAPKCAAYIGGHLALVADSPHHRNT